MAEKNSRRQAIAIDFDGTLCKYPRFIAPDKIPFEPVDGAREAVITLSKYFIIIVFSVRAKTEAGRKGIAEWMKKHEIPYNRITDKKPSCKLYIDDNALRFEGDWKKTVREVAEWQHYTKKK